MLKGWNSKLREQVSVPEGESFHNMFVKMFWEKKLPAVGRVTSSKVHDCDFGNDGKCKVCGWHRDG